MIKISYDFLSFINVIFVVSDYFIYKIGKVFPLDLNFLTFNFFDKFFW